MAEDQIEPSSITVHNKISDNYKSFHADGAYGGLTPRGLISLSFFSERFPIPKATDFAVKDGRMTDKISDSPDSNIGFIREYFTGVYMSIDVARDTAKLLNDKIAEFEKLTEKLTQNK